MTIPGIPACRAKVKEKCRYHSAVSRLEYAVALAVKAHTVEEQRLAFEQYSEARTTVNAEASSIFTREKRVRVLDDLSKLVKQATPQKPVLVENPPVGVVGRDKAGRLFVTSQTRIGPFDFNFGSLTSVEDAVELNRLDPAKEYQMGECGVLAADLWNRNPYVEEMYFLRTDSEPKDGVHILVKLKDGTYADSLGIWEKEDVVSSWKEVDPSAELMFYDEEGYDGSPPDPSATVYSGKVFEKVDSMIRARFES